MNIALIRKFRIKGLELMACDSEKITYKTKSGAEFSITPRGTGFDLNRYGFGIYGYGSKLPPEIWNNFSTREDARDYIKKNLRKAARYFNQLERDKSKRVSQFL